MSDFRLGLCIGCYVMCNMKETSVSKFIVRVLVIYSLFPSSEKLANVHHTISVTIFIQPCNAYLHSTYTM